MEASNMVRDVLRVKDDLGRFPNHKEYFRLGRFPESSVTEIFGSWIVLRKAAANRAYLEPQVFAEPKILFLDIECLPLEVYVWGLYDQNVGLNQIKEDWTILSYAAKFQGSKEMHYADQRNAKNIRDEKEILQGLWTLLDQADYVVGHNVRKFDNKKIRWRFLANGFKYAPSPYRLIDTLTLLRSNFGASSNSLAFATEKLTKHRKAPSKKFPGMELWTECLKGNKKAFLEMEIYNKNDVLVTEELYEVIGPWVKLPNFSVYQKNMKCPCGSETFVKNGHSATDTGIFQRFMCKKCRKPYKDPQNLIPKASRKKLRPM